MGRAYRPDTGILIDGEQDTQDIRIETAEIPAYVQDSLAAATLGLIHAILRQPGGREALDARTAARYAAAAAK